MAERALRWWVARDGNELLACWSLLGPGRGRRDGGWGRSAAGVGWTGWPGWAGIDHGAGSRLGTPGWRRGRCGGGLPGMATSYWRVGRCWVPAGDAGMAEGDGALRGVGGRDGLGGLGLIGVLGPGRGRRDGGGGRRAAGGGSTGWPGWAGIDRDARSRLGTPGWWRGTAPCGGGSTGWPWRAGIDRGARSRLGTPGWRRGTARGLGH